MKDFGGDTESKSSLDSEQERFEIWKEHQMRTFGANVFFSQKQWQNLWVAQPEMKAPSQESIESILIELGDCHRCALSKTRKSIVYGEGNPKARLFFIGEGPGEQEDLLGRPFVGNAGQLLDKIIEAMGFSRSDVYIANVVKCRPPGNRVPEEAEVQNCVPFLRRQINAVSPAVLVALGGTALKSLIGEDQKITRARGKFLEYDGRPLMPTYHPSFLLRNPDAKREVWQDMKLVMAKLKESEI